MENVQLPYHEALARLYELRALLDLYESGELEELAELPDGRCLDCAKHARRVQYGRVAVCRECATARIRIRNASRIRND